MRADHLSDPASRTLRTERTGRYGLSGANPANAEEVWLLLHGYGERADSFLQRCSNLSRQGRALIAPEGLSRFYAKGGTGEIGASWMTSDLRDEEIREYVDFVDSVMDAELGERYGSIPVTVLGFSQGGATAMRWSLLGKHAPETLVMWMSSFRADELEPHRERLHRLHVVSVVGEKDRFFNRHEYGEMTRVLNRVGCNWTELTRPGDHRVDADGLSALSAELSNRNHHT